MEQIILKGGTRHDRVIDIEDGKNFIDLPIYSSTPIKFCSMDELAVSLPKYSYETYCRTDRKIWYGLSRTGNLLAVFECKS